MPDYSAHCAHDGRHYRAPTELQIEGEAMNYAQAFEIASAAIKHRGPNFGHKYPEGAARDVALAVVEFDDPSAVIDVVVAKMETIEAEIVARG